MASERVNALGGFFADSLEETHDFAWELCDKYEIEIGAAEKIVMRIFRAGAEGYDRFLTNLRKASDDDRDRSG